MSRILLLALAVTLGLGSAANGLFMLISPANWYFAVPGVTTTGPFNQHFVRDIGLIFLLVAIAMLTGVARPMARVPLWSAAGLPVMRCSTSGKLLSAFVGPMRWFRISLLSPYRL